MSASPMQLLCSTGAFSRYPDRTDYRAVLDYGPELTVDGFELMFYPAWAAQVNHIASALQQSGLRFPAIHAEKSIGVGLGSTQPEELEQALRMMEANCQLGSALGSQLLVLHLWGWPDLDDHIERNLHNLGRCLDLTARYGLELAIETIPGRRFDALSNVQRAVEQDVRAKVALDTEFLARDHQLEEALDEAWLWRQGDVKHIHIKDYDETLFSRENTRRYLHPGEGNIDFAHVFTALKAHSFSGNISLEASALSDDGRADIDRIQKSLSLLRSLIES
ncbi:MAG TPA: sugar phosphate isomerase/epimerase family protein [Ktedonobacteraceae bacterium]|nr:sugar phosphate isomerase/epimerase family protein [Ktedonobacteraceae bacterium]